MTERKKNREVREPVQVYLTITDRKLLREVAIASGLSGAEVLRRGLRRMAGELVADRSPIVALIDAMARAEWAADAPADLARDHDRYLTEPLIPEAAASKSAPRTRAARRKR